MVTIRQERPVDEKAREALLDVAYGDERHGKPSAKLRRGRLPADGLALVAVERGARCQAEWEPVSRPDSAQIIRLAAPSDAKPVPTLADGAALIGTVRCWDVRVGGRSALLLGPLAVHPNHRGRGLGAALMRKTLAEAAGLGHGAVLLVGDAAYYSRFGFSAEKTARLWLSRKVDPARLLAVELTPGVLANAAGTITAAGRRIPIVLPALERRPRLIPRAA